ncbi:hypothetical protein [Fervidibacter sacchari]
MRRFIWTLLGSMLLVTMLVCVSSFIWGIVGKPKCSPGCHTNKRITSHPPLFPYYVCPANCQFVPDPGGTVPNECVHPPLYLLPPQHWLVPHLEIFATPDIYLWQCVPCSAPPGAMQPQFMEWYQIREYSCGLICLAIFNTNKGPGDQNPVQVVTCPEESL